MKRPPRAVVLAVLAVALVVVAIAVVVVVRVTSGPEKTIEVYADSSLRHAFADLGEAFEEETDVAVDLTVGTAGSLVGAIHDDDVGDVIAAGDPVTLVQVNDVLTGEPQVFAEDHLVIAVPEDNPGRIERVEDLRGARVAVCFSDEPCGRSAQVALAASGLAITPLVAADSAATIDLVVERAVDAALVFATEARAAGDAVETIELPWPGDRVSFPSIALLSTARDPDEGQDFIDFVMGDAGQEILAEHGFASGENPHLQPEG